MPSSSARPIHLQKAAYLQFALINYISQRLVAISACPVQNIHKVNHLVASNSIPALSQTHMQQQREAVTMKAPLKLQPAPLRRLKASHNSNVHYY